MPSAVVALLLAAAIAAAAIGGVTGHGEQPLAKINVTGSQIKLDGAYSIHASPDVLGGEGEDSVWVTVEFSSPHAYGGDWIGVFSPAITDDGWKEGPQAPKLAFAPIKYKMASRSLSYKNTGKGSVQFLLINQRYNFNFGIFTGDIWGPSLKAVSNVISFANPKAPVYPRLAQGKAWNEMTVTWTSGYDISEATPFVEWSLRGGRVTRTPAGTLSFDQWAMCGDPARSVGWRDPGFIHTAFLKELWPNKEYYYQIGHELQDGTIVWGKSSHFRASPYPGQISLQQIVIFGDMGKAERDGSNEYSDSQHASLTTTDRLVKDLDNIDIVFHIGDIAYANGYVSQWDQFTAQVEPITSKVPYMIASGNHERAWPNSGSFYNTSDSGGECGVLAETMYYVPAENRAKFWYSVDYGMFRFCVANSELDWREGTQQYKFIEHCFATVDRKHQPWLIFIAHRPLGYSSGSHYGNDEGTYGEPMGRAHLQKLWQKYRVDIGFYGHLHQYERTCPVYESQCTTKDNFSYYSGLMTGTTHVVAGGGGAGLHRFSNSFPNWSVHRDDNNGFVKLTSANHTKLVFEYKRSNDGQVYDQFVINRDYRDVLQCTLDSCGPITFAT